MKIYTHPLLQNLLWKSMTNRPIYLGLEISTSIEISMSQRTIFTTTTGISTLLGTVGGGLMISHFVPASFSAAATAGTASTATTVGLAFTVGGVLSVVRLLQLQQLLLILQTGIGNQYGNHLLKNSGIIL
jgi:hypothetical protein